MENELGMDEADCAAPAALPAKPLTVDEFDKFLEELRSKDTEAKEATRKAASLNNEVTAMKARAAQWLKEANRNSYKSAHGTIYRIEKWRFSNPSTDDEKRAFFASLQERGEAVYLKYATVNNNSLNSFMNAEMEVAKKEGRMDYLLPGIKPAALQETVGFRK